MKSAEQWATEHQTLCREYNHTDYVEMPSEQFAALVREIQSDALIWASEKADSCYYGKQAARPIMREAVLLKLKNKKDENINL
jgi:hypothetical protein